ncbi:hypothetical protein [Desulfocicer vacuolatum]|nr:hypothetical protein [Desulfocicer vacuolatum]
MKYSAIPGSISNFVVGGTESEYGLPVAVYMKYLSNQRCLSSFVVGRAGSEYGLPVAVLYTMQPPRQPQQY